MSNLTPNQIERNEIEDNIIKSIRNVFSLEKNNTIDDRMGRDMKVLFKSEEEDHYEPVRIDNNFVNNYID